MSFAHCVFIVCKYVMMCWWRFNHKGHKGFTEGTELCFCKEYR
jgi:hypothetical protein